MSLTPEEKLGFERFVEEVQVVDSDKPKCSDFDALAYVPFDRRGLSDIFILLPIFGSHHSFRSYRLPRTNDSLCFSLYFLYFERSPLKLGQMFVARPLAEDHLAIVRVTTEIGTE